MTLDKYERIGNQNIDITYRLVPSIQDIMELENQDLDEVEENPFYKPGFYRYREPLQNQVVPQLPKTAKNSTEMPEEPQSHESDQNLSDESYDSDIQESFTDSDVGEEGLEYLKDDLNAMENGKFKLIYTL